FDALGSVANWKTSGNYPEPFLSWIQKYGGAIYYRTIFNHNVLLSYPVALQHVLVSNAANFPREDVSRSFFRDIVLGDGLFSAEGKQHDQYRKLLNPLFTTSKIKTFIKTFHRQTQIYCQNILEPACNNLEPVNFANVSHPWCLLISLAIVFTRLTLSIVGLTVLGFNFDENPSAIEAYEQSMIQMSPLMMVGSYVIPGFTSFPLPTLLKRRKAQYTLKKILMQIIQDKLAASSSDHPKHLLDMILTNSSTEEAVSRTVTFMLAGHDTISNTLSFVFGMLVLHPDVVAAVRAEYSRVALKHGSLTTWEAVSELQYTYAVIQETLRLNAVAIAILARTSVADDHIPMVDGSTVFIPKVMLPLR
ncbi:unnamed protein product, partial [Aphanomyces euteiches]